LILLCAFIGVANVLKSNTAIKVAVIFEKRFIDDCLWY